MSRSVNSLQTLSGARQRGQRQRGQATFPTEHPRNYFHCCRLRECSFRLSPDGVRPPLPGLREERAHVLTQSFRLRVPLRRDKSLWATTLPASGLAKVCGHCALARGRRAQVDARSRALAPLQSGV